MIAAGLAKRYAKALEEAAAEADALEAVGTELERVATLWHQDPAMAAFFGNPGILLRDKKETLKSLSQRMALSPLVARFLDLLLSRHRMQALPAMALLYRDLARLRTTDDGVQIRQRDPDELRWDGAPRDAWEAFCEEWGLDRLRSRPHRWLDES